MTNAYPHITFKPDGTASAEGCTVEHIMATLHELRASKDPKAAASRTLRISVAAIEEADAFARDSWCSPSPIAKLLPPRDQLMDPCSNPRSHVDAIIKIMLETRGDGLAEPWGRGLFVYINAGFSNLLPWAEKLEREIADAKMFPRKPEKSIRGVCYMTNHDHSTRWFQKLGDMLPCLLLIDARQRFVPHPGVPSSTNNKPQSLIGDREFFEACDPRLFELGEMYEKTKPRRRAA